MKIYFVSVVKDFDLYKKLVTENQYVKGNENIECVCFDNSADNQFISKRYNQFLNEYDYNNEAWFVFCHSDWEVLEDLTPKLKNINKNKIYGPIGQQLVNFDNKYINKSKGSCHEKRRNGTEEKIAGKHKHKTDGPVDTVDCQALFVHSSLVNKHHLRFDENLQFDLYVEDFCISALLNHNIETRIIRLECCHWSDAGYSPIPQSYKNMLEYVNKKYPNSAFAGTCSVIGGKEIELASKKERRQHYVRTKLKEMFSRLLR